jgi:predicted TIM-barrel fold metal-dependent hydrolase
VKAFIFSVVLLSVVVASDRNLPDGANSAVSSAGKETGVISGGFSPQELQSFTSLEPIDTHTHVRRSDPGFDAMLDRLNVHVLDIILVDDRNPEENDLRAERDAALKFIRGSGGRAVLCTSFDPFKMAQPGFTESAIRGLNDDFGQGAIAVKIWKNIGMEIKDAHGSYVLPDDPAFGPIYKDIAARNKTVIAHVADPDSAWAPPNPASPDYSYFQKNPEWFMYGKPHPASKQRIIQARDHILEQNPSLRVVGAHLGSMEADFHQLARHFDRYPNFAVDLAARMPYLALQPHADVIAFILKYQDRLIYATDLGFSPGDKAPAAIDSWEQTYARDWRFLATNDAVEFGEVKGQGLALPDPVLRKIYHDNAVQWFLGILKGGH